MAKRLKKSDKSGKELVSSIVVTKISKDTDGGKLIEVTETVDGNYTDKKIVMNLLGREVEIHKFDLYKESTRQAEEEEQKSKNKK